MKILLAIDGSPYSKKMLAYLCAHDELINAGRNTFTALTVLPAIPPRARAVFDATAEEADTAMLLAFNQGFYNLFLALVTAVGIAMVILGHRSVGSALILAGVGSMLAAALVLVASAPEKKRAAVTQGAFPLVATVLLVASLS